MYAMIASAILNMVLDPIFIYYLNWGVKGAAIATLISSIFVILILCYWFYIKKDTYLKPVLSNLDFKKSIGFDIVNTLARNSYTVVFTYNTSEENALLLKNKFDNVFPFRIDFQSESDIWLPSHPMLLKRHFELRYCHTPPIDICFRLWSQNEYPE